MLCKNPSNADVFIGLSTSDIVTPAMLKVMAKNPIVFAMANPDILKQYPCYCGCQEVLAHMHNLDCYIKQFYPDGSIEVDPHGLA